VEFRVGPNPGVIALAVSALLRWDAGFPDRAVDHMERALRLARELDHPYSMAYALHHASLLHIWRMDFASVAGWADESLRLATTHDYPVWKALALISRGTATVASGRHAAGLAEIEDGFALYRELSTPPVFWPALLTIRASAYAMVGDVDRALVFMTEAEESLQLDDPLLAEVAIARGEVLLSARAPDFAAADALFERAAALAARRAVPMVELQALTRLAVIRRGSTGGAEARRLLRDCYESFTEGFDTPQLVAARAALADG
jgi:ATP/maltotriose-dependent transcriptional regulator MalT